MALRLHQKTLALLLVLLLAVWSSSAHGADSHDHDHAHKDEATEAAEATAPWETSSIWEFSTDTYTIKFCAANDEVVGGGGMIFELLALASTEESDVNTTVEQADKIFNTFASDEVVRESVKSGKTLTVKTNATAPDVLYRVEFSTEQQCVEATLPVTSAGAFMFFTQHGGDEVSVEVQNSKAQAVSALKCQFGCEEEGADEAGSSEKSDSWLGPIAASLMISLTSFVGVVILGMSKSRIDSVVEYMTSFAAGCLLGVVVFHLYPEGSEYLADLGEWVTGVWVLAGIVFSMSVESGVHMILSAFGADHHHAHGGHSHGDHQHQHPLLPEDAEKGLARISLQAGAETSYVSHPTTPGHIDATAVNGDVKPQQSFSDKYIKSLKYVEPVAWITAVGDFFHAFTDGVVLAVAFKSCSSSLGWAVALGVVLHEVPHRVGDFFIYLKAGMEVSQALVVNFFASLASLMGAVILLAAGSVSDHALGYLMGFGCGALLFIGLGVLLPPMLAVRERRRTVIHFVWFSLGCILIGLSVLQHKHCDAAGGTEHNHNH